RAIAVKRAARQGEATAVERLGAVAADVERASGDVEVAGVLNRYVEVTSGECAGGQVEGAAVDVEIGKITGRRAVQIQRSAVAGQGRAAVAVEVAARVIGSAAVEIRVGVDRHGAG